MSTMYEKVRRCLHNYYNPEKFVPEEFRGMLMIGIMGLLLGELMTYSMLKQSAAVGELPYYVIDVLIIAISSLEFLLCWAVGWLGSLRRRTVMVTCMAVLLACAFAGIFTPEPEATQDDGLCNTGDWPLLDVVSSRTAIRLAMLVALGLGAAFARLGMIAHGLAYLDEHNPTDNTQMHVGIFFMLRVLFYLILYPMVEALLGDAWRILYITMCLHCLVTLPRLFRYPQLAPSVATPTGSERNICRSFGRVLSSRVAMLQMIAMGCLTASFWGFGYHKGSFTETKFHEQKDQGYPLQIFRGLIPIIISVVLAGFLYTAPVMPKYDRKAAIRNAITMSILTAVFYVGISNLFGCSPGEIAGVGRESYTKPACAQDCGCDRPWMEYTPVCATNQMMTYFSPCHAGCSVSETVNNADVYSNCTCAGGGLVTVGPCDDGHCAARQELHQLFVILIAIMSSVALVCQGAVVVQSVDRRDVSVAVAVASGTVSLIAFVGGHCFYFGISYFTCIFNDDLKCMFHATSFVGWTGYTSAVLALLSAIFGIAAVIVLGRQEDPVKEEESTLRLRDSS